MTKPVLSLQDAALSLDGNAGRVDILHDITLTVNQGRNAGAGRAVRIGQILAADADGRVGTGDHRPDQVRWATT